MRYLIPDFTFGVIFSIYIFRVTSLFLFSAYCNDPAYLEPYCDKKGCKPRNDERGHYFCNKYGKKVCLAGWKNEKSDCLEGIVKLLQWVAF